MVFLLPSALTTYLKSHTNLPPSSSQARKKTTKEAFKLPTQLPWKKKPKWVPLRSVFLIRSNLDGTYLRRPLPTIVVLRKPMIVEGVTKMLEFLMIMGAERATVPIKGNSGLSSPTHIPKFTPASNQRYHHVPVVTFTRKLRQESPL